MSESPTNNDRADRVERFVAEYAEACYWGTEHLDVVVSDMISDLLHFVRRGNTDALPEHITVDPDEVDWEVVVESAVRSTEHEAAFGWDEETD